MSYHHTLVYWQHYKCLYWYQNLDLIPISRRYGRNRKNEWDEVQVHGCSIFLIFWELHQTPYFLPQTKLGCFPHFTMWFIFQPPTFLWQALLRNDLIKENLDRISHVFHESTASIFSYFYPYALFDRRAVTPPCFFYSSYVVTFCWHLIPR